MDESWLPVVGYEGLYEISDLGRVRSLDRVVVRKNGAKMPCRGTTMRPFRTPPMGYLAVKLARDGKKMNYRIHVLVAEAFIGQRQPNMVVCHNSGDKDDNSLSNLRWDTASENLRDTVRHGRHYQANKTHCRYGHEFTLENTYVNATSGGRQCRECMKLHHRNSRARLMSL